MPSPRSFSLGTRRWHWIGVVLALVMSLTAAPSRLGAAEKGFDKAAEQWLREVRLLILPEEESVFRGLSAAEDRKEFQKIFWARRDPDPATPRNEMEDALVKGRQRADDLFTTPYEKGALTGCGQVFLLLGDPLEVQGAEARQVQGRGAREQFDSLRPMRDGARPPETWVYRSRLGDPVVFTGGELRIAFDDACRFPEGGRLLEDLQLVARSRIVRALAYEKAADGRLVPLETLLRKSGPAAAATASDFPLALEPKLMLRTQSGVGYAAGLVRADLSGASLPSGAGPLTGNVFVEATSPTGASAGKAQRAFSASVAADSSLTASYGLTLKPGQYTLRVGLRLSNGKSSSAAVPVEVPDFDAPGLRIAPLILYPNEPPTAPDPKDPYSALTVGSLLLKPRFGDAFRASDALQVVSVLSGGKADAATSKAALHARFTLMKDGKPVARGAEDVFDTSTAVASIGPVPLTGYAAGRYVVKLEVTDKVAGTTAVEERPFEIKE